LDINRTWESIRESVKNSVKESVGYYILKQLKPWFDKCAQKWLDQRKTTLAETKWNK